MADKARPDIFITVLSREGKCPHHRMTIGTRVDFYKSKNRICPLAVHEILPYINELRDSFDQTRPKVLVADYECPGFDVKTHFKVELVPPEQN